MLFSTFATYLSRIEETTLRNTITEILANIFGELAPDEVEPACWLLLGRIVPAYEGVEFQFAEKMMTRALAQATGIGSETIQKAYKESGDLAETAQAQISNFQFPTSNKLSILEMYQELQMLARENGEGSQERKVERVVKLLQELDPVSVKFIVRIILTKLRLGFSDMTILDALSWAKVGDKSDRPAIEDAYQVKHDIGKVAKAYLLGGKAALESFDIELGIPLQPALCQRLKTAQEMIEKMGRVYVEPKYDGTRVQIHIHNKELRIKNKESRDQAENEHTPLVSPLSKGGSTGGWNVRTFTRSLEESSAQFPELEEAIRVFGDHEVILDCEAIGYNPKTGELLPFQETIQRKRKHDVDLFSSQIPLKFFVFDILFLDGQSLVKLPLQKRKDILSSLLKDAATTDFVISPAIVTESADELRDYHKAQLDAGLEGVVVKQYESIYQPGRKGWSWVKFKEEEAATGQLSDTIDAVVMGYWYGKGKRQQFGIGAFLIGILGPEDKILTLSKVGTGLSDEQFRELKRRCEAIVVLHKPASYVVDKALVPDVWVEPAIVTEVAGDELTISPTHTAKKALRFPRLVRFRDDKKTGELTTLEELEAIVR